jgi:hypothetical protein
VEVPPCAKLLILARIYTRVTRAMPVPEETADVPSPPPPPPPGCGQCEYALKYKNAEDLYVFQNMNRAYRQWFGVTQASLVEA